MLTKKKIAVFMPSSTAVFFTLFFKLLPIEIVEPRLQHGMWFFLLKILFLSLTASAILSFLIIIIFKREFVKMQFQTYSRFKYLLRLLVKRDFIARYRKSVFGVLWSILNPLLTMLVMTMVFAHVFRYDIPNLPVYILSGQIIFSFFSESTNRAMNSIISSAGMIKKVYIPKYIFPFSCVLSSLVNLFFSLCALVLVFVITHSQFYWTMLLIPIPIFYTFVFSLGVGMTLSSLNVFFRDLSHLYSVFVALLMYLSAIFYPVSSLPSDIQAVLGLNPMYHFIDYFRSLVLDGAVPDVWSNIVCIGFAASMLCVGIYTVMAKQDKYILYI